MKKFLSVLALMVVLTIAPSLCLAGVDVSSKTISRGDDIKVSYPVLVNLEDLKIQKTINQEIENEIKDFIKVERKGNSDKTISGNFQVRYTQMDTLSITMDLITKKENAAYPKKILKGFNYDLNTGERLQYNALQNVSQEDVNKALVQYLKDKDIYLPDFKGINFVPAEFYIDERGDLVSIIQEQAIAPHAAGTLEFKVF